MTQVARVQCECPMISVSSCAEQVCHVGASGSHKKTDPPDPQNMKSITNRCGLTKRDEPVLVFFLHNISLVPNYDHLQGNTNSVK